MTGVFEKPSESTDKDKEPLNAYHKVKDVDVCYNTFVNCKNIDLGKVSSYKYPATNPYFAGQTVKGELKPECTIAYNVFYNPSLKSIINRIGSNDELVTYYGNLFTFKDSFTLKGFEKRNLDFENNNGIYRLKNSDNTVLGTDQENMSFNYVNNDITGNVRGTKKDTGAYQYANRNNVFSTVKPSECGINWYSTLKTEQDKITGKTSF